MTMVMKMTMMAFINNKIIPRSKDFNVDNRDNDYNDNYDGFDRQQDNSQIQRLK